MKKLLLFLGVIMASVSAQAQSREFKPFKVDVAYGVGVPNGSKVGFLVAVEPKYALHDQFAVGLRIEGVNVYRTLSGSGTTDAHYIRSYGLTGDYYFSKVRSRVFVGLVAGLYQYAAATVNLENLRPLTSVQFGAAQLGFAPRLGVELGHFRVGTEYNFTLGPQVSNTSYFSVKAGVVIGGGKYNKTI